MLETLEDTVKESFAFAASVEPDTVNRDSILSATGQIDSVDLGCFYADLEDEFDIEIPDEKCQAFVKLGEVIDYVSAKISE